MPPRVLRDWLRVPLIVHPPPLLPVRFVLRLKWSSATVLSTVAYLLSDAGKIVRRGRGVGFRPGRGRASAAATRRAHNRVAPRDGVGTSHPPPSPPRARARICAHRNTRTNSTSNHTRRRRPNAGLTGARAGNSRARGRRRVGCRVAAAACVRGLVVDSPREEGARPPRPHARPQAGLVELNV